MFVAPVLALLLAAGDSYTLEWKLKEGDVFYNKMSVELEQTVELMGQKIDQKFTMKTVLKFQVKSTGVGGTVIEMTYLDHNVDAGGLPGVNVGSKLKGVTFTGTLSERMEVTKLEGYDKFIDALGDDDNQKRLLKTIIPESAIQQTFSQTFVTGPGKPIVVGDTWNRKTALALGPLGGAEMKETFKLEGVKGDLATVSEKADISFKAGDAESGLPFKITKADLKTDGFAASHTFNLKTGRVNTSKRDIDLAGDMTLSVAGKSVDARLTQKMKTACEITERNPVKE